MKGKGQTEEASHTPVIVIIIIVEGSCCVQ